MTGKKKRKNDDDLNFWQPASDMFSALLLILMLVILLLGLYLVHIPEHNQLDPWAGDTYAGSDYDDDDDAASTTTPQPTATVFFWFGGDGNGGGETPHPTYTEYYQYTQSPSPTPSPTVSPTPDLPGSGGGTGGGDGGGNGQGEGPGEEPDMGMKSAVYVMIVDAETDRTIKAEGVEFELYGENSAIQLLNTYYPERITYRFYETTDLGTFYFPEKLQLGAYILHALTEPEGYDKAENQLFVLEETYDWPDPYVVRVPLYPSRNIIRVQMTDEETRFGIPGGSFAVIAAENIITADGTLRYRKGQRVSEIICDEEGYGESEEIYLGNYYLRQMDIPPYYVSLQEDVEVEVAQKSIVLPPIHTVASARTKIYLQLTDELYPERPIANVPYLIRMDSGRMVPFEMKTDASGSFTLDSLEKAASYRISQTGTVDNYILDTMAYNVNVTADGRIEGEAEKTLTLSNHMIRVAIGITDEFSDVQVPNINLALYTRSGTLVRTWTTTGSPLLFTDLAAGSYYIIKDGDTSTRFDIQVVDQVEQQTINLHTTYVMQYVIIGVSAALAAAIIAGTTVFIVRRRRKKKAGG